MSATTPSPRTVAEQYAQAWLGGDVDKAMTYIAEDIVCEAPSGLIRGASGYRQFLEPFSTALQDGELVNVLADDTHAVTVYRVEMPFAKDFRGTEYLTVDNGTITQVISVFDMSPMLQASHPAQD